MTRKSSVERLYVLVQHPATELGPVHFERVGL